MKTFQDLINDGIAPMRQRDWGKLTPLNASDPIQSMCNDFNNTYGVATSMHMDVFEDGVILTGRLPGYTDDFTQFFHALQWQGITFKESFSDWLQQRNMCGSLQTVNGGVAFVAKKCGE